MLFQSINKIKRSSIIISMVLIALGIVMMICPGGYTMSLISGLGYASMVLALVMMLEYLPWWLACWGCRWLFLRTMCFRSSAGPSGFC